MNRNEILEYPYNGTITHVVQGTGRNKDTETVIYEGVMDETMTTDEQGRVMQTSGYVISIPLTKDNDGKWIVPTKGDKISITEYGQTFSLVVDNVEPSQLGGISINATRKSW